MNPALRALVVEDDRSWQQILNEILTDAGLEVDTTDNLGSAVGLISHKPHRLAVIDLSLGGSDHHNTDGLKVLAEIQKRDPGCISILLTGFATVEIAVSALTDLGAFSCLQKELFHRVEFRELIQRALATPPPFTDEEALKTGGDRIMGRLEEAGEQISTLVVEDDAGWRGIFQELLEDAGYQVRLCNSYGEALGCLRRENYVLAVVDLSLERSTFNEDFEGQETNQALEGYRLLSSIRESGARVIVVSGIATPQEIEQAYREQGIFAFIEKQNFERRVFLETIQEAAHSQQVPSELMRLTSRERDVLRMLAKGLTNKEIAEALVITPNTVKRHLKSIFEKLGIHTRSAAAAMATSWYGKVIGEDRRIG